jgi:preprotein translocase subunit YajC
MGSQLTDFFNKYGYFIWIIVFVGIFYLTAILPQRRRQKRHKELIDSLKVGDKVTTIGGIFGTIKRIHEDRFLLTVGPRSDIEFTKNAVIGKITEK